MKDGRLYLEKLLPTNAVLDCLLSGNWYALLDGVLIENLPTQLAEAEIPCFCLFDADVPDEYKRIAPYLVRFEANAAGFLGGMLDGIQEHHASFLRYTGDNEALAERFQAMVHAKLPDERVGVLRFQDSRVLNVLLGSLSPSHIPFFWPSGLEEYLLYAGEHNYNSWTALHDAEMREQTVKAPLHLSVAQLDALSEDYHTRFLNRLVAQHRDSFVGSEMELSILLGKVVDEGMECGFILPRHLCDYVAKVVGLGWLHSNMQERHVAILRRNDLNAPMKLSQINE